MISQYPWPEATASGTKSVNLRSLLGSAFLLLCVGASCEKKSSLAPDMREASMLTASDVASSTRLETHFVQPVTDVFSSTWGKQSVLSIDETAYIQSVESFTVDEPQRIRAISEKMAKAKRLTTRRSDGIYLVPDLRNVARVVCYRGANEATSFMLKERCAFTTQDDQWFDFADTGLDLFDFAPHVQPFALRYACAHNIRELGDGARFAAPSGWCDAVQQRFSEVGAAYLAHAMQCFRCPAAGEGKCHYAMNSDYRRNSVADVVLLFEAKASWNQHGGPELFTFDNHDPKGGLVLLNDGTVKFICTEEELKQLRWK